MASLSRGWPVGVRLAFPDVEVAGVAQVCERLVQAGGHEKHIALFTFGLDQSNFGRISLEFQSDLSTNDRDLEIITRRRFYSLCHDITPFWV